MELDQAVKEAIYGFVAQEGRPPVLDETAAQVGAGRDDVRAACQRLGVSRQLVLMPDGESIRMAGPFSGVPTQHVVRAKGRRYFANCAWDAFGIPAALRAEAEVESRCEQSGEPLLLHCGLDGPPPTPSWVFHSVVPAAHWWRDVVYT